MKELCCSGKIQTVRNSARQIQEERGEKARGKNLKLKGAILKYCVMD